MQVFYNKDRYVLAPKSFKREKCPHCDHKGRDYRRYCDTLTGELIPELFGLCNHCNHRLSPYSRGQSGGDCWAWLQHQQERELVAAGMYTPPPMTPRVVVERPVVPLPEFVVDASKQHYDRNVFVQLLRRTFGIGHAQELVARFEVGTSSYWPGATVFWQRDELGRVRGGQIKLFDADGHTAKRTTRDGDLKSCTSWIHTAAAVRYERAGEALPEWLQAYIDADTFSPCLFGLSQLAYEPRSKPVALVESPKTAVLATGYFPDFIWLATGSLDQLTADRLAPLKGRKIELWPDFHPTGKVYQNWAARAEALNQQGFSITVNDYEQGATAEQRAAKWDLGDFILEQWHGFPPSWGMEEREVLAAAY